jgi:serine-type D-Ala-D-Ala carboxypeptidase (penicillin-binding protein 5/6)
MLRSLISLLILANVNTAEIHNTEYAIPFDPLSLLQIDQVPTKEKNSSRPDIKAKAAILIDANSGIVLYEKNSHKSLPMASLTKIMTAILILESHELDEVVTIEESYLSTPGVKIWLQKGERIKIRDLLIGLLVRSGGDAALALADYHSGSVEAFVKSMNEKAAILNLQHTQFKNPIGLDQDAHYASAYDLAMLSKYAMRKPDFRWIVHLPEAEVFSVDGNISHSFKSTNKLLGSYLNILGVKTGTTDAAGESVINLARNQKGNEVIAIVLNSPNRFQENKSLIDWGFRSYTW